jgi:repressor LexA
METSRLSKRLTGQVVASITHLDASCLTIHFASGTNLVVKRMGNGVTGVVEESGNSRSRSVRSESEPTQRQRDYLEFIKRYMARYGVAPAESDIQRHFMVSAPSVNQMIRTLERRGFLTRARDFSGQALPRSIRVTVDNP